MAVWLHWALFVLFGFPLVKFDICLSWGVSVVPARPRFYKEFILKTTDLPETISTCSTRTSHTPNINWSPIKQQKCIKLILAEQKHSAMDSWINTCRMDEQTGAGGEYGRTEVQVQMDGGGGKDKKWKWRKSGLQSSEFGAVGWWWNYNRRKCDKIQMTETSFPRYKTSGNGRVLFLPQSVLCLTSVLCGFKRVAGDRICLSGLRRREDFISVWQLKRAGGVLIGLRRMAESKDEEEVVMVMMRKMWDLGCSIR